MSRVCVSYSLISNNLKTNSLLSATSLLLSFVKLFKSNYGNSVAIPITTLLLQHRPKLSVCTCLHPLSQGRLAYNLSFNI